MDIGNIANNAGWDCFKTPILREILRTQNLLLKEHYAFLEVIRLFQSAGYAGLRLDGKPALDLWDLIVKAIRWEKVPDWDCLFVNREKGLFLSVSVDVIDGTADSLRKTVAAVLQRLSVLEDQVKQFQNMDHSAMRRLNIRFRAVGAGAGVTVSAAKGYLPEKSTLPKIFDGSVEDWRGWKYDFTYFLDTKEHRHVLVSGRNCEEQR